MMNRRLLIVAGLVLTIAVGVYLFQNNNPSTQSGSNGSVNSNNSQNIEEVVSMVMDAYEGTGSIKCTFQDETSQGIAYIKNGNVRVESSGIDGAQYGNVIISNDTLWLWEDGGSEGFIVENISQFQQDPDTNGDDFFDVDKVRDQIAQDGANCNPENISESMFEPPVGIDFQNSNAALEEANIQIPEGFELPEGIELPEGFELPEGY